MRSLWMCAECGSRLVRIDGRWELTVDIGYIIISRVLYSLMEYLCHLLKLSKFGKSFRPLLAQRAKPPAWPCAAQRKSLAQHKI